MTYEKRTIKVGNEEHEVLKCIGEGQCQCKSCKEKGIYNVSWTSFFYALKENDGVLCRDCLDEHFIQERIKRETERLKDESCYDYHCMCLAQQEKAELQKQVDELKEQRDVFKKLYESANESPLTPDKIIDAMNSFYREQAEHLAGLLIEQAIKDAAPLAIQRFINQLYIDHIIMYNDLENEMLKVKSFVLKRYYCAEVE